MAEGEQWYQAPTVGLDATGADKDLVAHLQTSNYPDMKSALRATMTPKGIDATPYAEIGWSKPEAFAFDPKGADKDLAEYAAGKHYPDFRTLLRSASEAERIARDRNAMPRPEKGKEAEWKGWSELGWVEDPAKYVFGKKAAVPEGVQYDQAQEDELRLAAHEERVPLATAEKLRDRMVASQLKRIEGTKAAGAKSSQDLQAALDQKWGPDKARNIELGKRAAKAFGINMDDAAALERIIGSPALVEGFYNMAALIGEQALPPLSGSGTGGSGESHAQLRAEIDRLNGDPAFVQSLRDERHPMNKQNTARRQELINKLAKLETGG